MSTQLLVRACKRSARLLYVPGQLTAYVLEVSRNQPDSLRGCSHIWGRTSVAYSETVHAPAFIHASICMSADTHYGCTGAKGKAAGSKGDTGDALSAHPLPSGELKDLEPGAAGVMAHALSVSEDVIEEQGVATTLVSSCHFSFLGRTIKVWQTDR